MKWFFRLPWIGILVWGLLGLTGCTEPCRELTKKICLEFQATPKLCQIARESTAHGVSARHCSALLSTWRVAGKQQIRSLSERYRIHKESVELNLKKSASRREKLDRAEIEIRRGFRTLLQSKNP